MVSEFWITSRVGPENSRSRPRSMVTLATIETITAGSTAITENRPTICTCSRAAARPRRLACTIWTISRTMIPTRSRMVTAVDHQEGADDVAGRLDRGQPRQHHEGEEGRQQRDADGERRKPSPQGKSLTFGKQRVEGCGRSLCARHSGKVIADNVIGSLIVPGFGTDAFISHCCQYTAVLNNLVISVAYQFQALLLATIYPAVPLSICRPLRVFA